MDRVGSRAWSVLVGLMVVTVVAACAGPAGTSEASTGGDVQATEAPSSTASDAATPPATPSPAAATPTTQAPLPVAEIVTADATIVGALGSYAIDGRGSDAPWLPFDSLPQLIVGRTEPLTVRFSDGVAIGDVSAVIATADDTSGSSPRDAGGTVLAPDATTVSIGPLPVGRWVLQVRLFRADGRGDGLTYWAVTVR